MLELVFSVVPEGWRIDLNDTNCDRYSLGVFYCLTKIGIFDILDRYPNVKIFIPKNSHKFRTKKFSGKWINVCRSCLNYVPNRSEFYPVHTSGGCQHPRHRRKSNG